MVLNNLTAVNRQLPPLASKHSVWLQDFMLGTTFFNFFLLVEYAAPLHASLAPRHPSPPPPASLHGR